MNDGTELRCQKHSIFLRLPKKYQGKIHGLAGGGLGASQDWACGPNSDACPECKPGQTLAAMKNQCPPQYVYGNPNHPLNGNRVTKPLVRWFNSWQVDGNHIPSVFYYKDGQHGPGSFNRKNGEKIKPPQGTNQQPKSKKQKAHDACKAFRESPKMRAKCIFDFILGKVATKDSKKDRMNQRAANKRVVTTRSVRDISRYKNDGEWTQHVSWGCAGEFLKQQGSSVKRFSEQKRARLKRGSTKLEADEPISVPQGRWIESAKEFEVPIDFEADIKASGAPGSIFVSLLNSNGKLNGGLTLESGAVKGIKAKIFQSRRVPKTFELAKNDEWHTVRIKANSDGAVIYLLNGKVIYKGKTSKKKGRVAFIGGNTNMQVRNVKVTVQSDENEKAKRKCFGIAEKNPQDSADIAKLPACDGYHCDPTVCICTCPGSRCDTIPGVVGRLM